MFDKFKDFLINKAVGRVLVRVVGSLAVGLASGSWGISIDLSPEEQMSIVTGVIAGFNGIVSYLKPRDKAVVAPAA